MSRSEENMTRARHRGLSLHSAESLRLHRLRPDQSAVCWSGFKANVGRAGWKSQAGCQANGSLLLVEGCSASCYFCAMRNYYCGICVLIWLPLPIPFCPVFFSPGASILGARAWSEALIIVNTLEITARLFKGRVINPAMAQRCDSEHFHTHFKHSR